MGGLVFYKFEPNSDECKRKEPYFTINDMDANYNDFGTILESNEEGWEFACPPEEFIPKMVSSKILSKYKISEAEYNQICNMLIENLSFSGCAWCQ